MMREGNGGGVEVAAIFSCPQAAHNLNLPEGLVQQCVMYDFKKQTIPKYN